MADFKNLINPVHIQQSLSGKYLLYFDTVVVSEYDNETDAIIACLSLRTGLQSWYAKQQ